MTNKRQMSSPNQRHCKFTSAPTLHAAV